MKKLILAILLSLTIPMTVQAEEQPVLEKIRCTVYSSKPDAKTFSGIPVRSGVASGKRDWLGRTAILYDMDMRIIDIIEFLDTGSANGLNQGKVIDVWQPTKTDCEEFIAEYGDYVYLQWVD